MAKTPKISEPENKTIGLQMDSKASEVASELDNVIMSELNRISAAKQEWEGGRFVVMRRLTVAMGDAIDELPHPKDKTGNNPAWYKVPVIRISDKGKRTETWKEKYFYTELARNLPGVVAKAKLKGQIERSLGDDETTNKADIPDEVMNWTLPYRNAMIAKLNNEIKSAEQSVTGAFELHFQLEKFKELKHVRADLVFALNEAGLPCDGEDGREWRVENTNTPIIITSTVKGRHLTDTKMVSLGQFLRYDLDKAAEQGTYDAVMNTVKREKPEEQSGETVIGNAQDQSRPQLINTPDTFSARLVDMTEYLTRLSEEKSNAGWQALDKAVHADGNDEAFMAGYECFHFLKSLFGSPADEARAAKLREQMNEAA